jgi:peptidyl-Lys metalloendopeptidase
LKIKLFVYAALALALTAFPALAARSLADVTITFEKASFGSDESVPVTVSITNPNKGPIRILRWLTPVDGVEDDLFVVTANGKPVEYIGKHFKRAAPADKDYLILRAGETIDARVDLSGFYDLSQTGFYEVAFRADSFSLYSKTPDFSANEDFMQSAKVSAWIGGRVTKFEAEPLDSVIGSTGFTSCTSTRQSSLLTARDNAYSYSVNSFDYLNAGTVGPRYTTWFGTYNSTRYNKVKGNFGSIRDAMNNASVTFNCTCTSSAYAYVYSNQPYTIYLCNAFWNAPSTGTDSKAGTLVHEMSHFTVVAGTSDYAYGQSAASRLASTNPKRAIANADNHEYFAENTPSQP